MYGREQFLQSSGRKCVEGVGLGKMVGRKCIGQDEEKVHRGCSIGLGSGEKVNRRCSIGQGYKLCWSNIGNISNNSVGQEGDHVRLIKGMGGVCGRGGYVG